MKKPPARLVLLATALVAALTAASVVVVQLRPGSVSAVERVAVLERCLRTTQDNVDRATVDQAFIDCAAAALGSDPDSTTLFGVLGEVFASRTRDDFLGKVCHDVAHAVGTLALDALGDAALSTGYEECSFGYYHGLMLAAAGTGSPQETLERLGEFCGDYVVIELQPSNLDFCAHGVGHAIASRVDFVQGASLCARLTTIVDRRHGAEIGTQASPLVNCFTGVLNEKLRYDYNARTGPESVPDALSICDAVPADLLTSCARYALHYSRIALGAIREFCAVAPLPGLVVGCWQAVGFRGVDMLTAPGFFDGSDTLGALADLNADAFLRSTTDAARYLDLLCAGDPDGSCFQRFSLEMTQATQRPEFLFGVCDALTAEIGRTFCTDGVRRIASNEEANAVRPTA